MLVGAALLEIHVHASQSLKEKRGVVRSISQRLRNRFNLAVAEVGGQGTWQRAVLALAAVGSDPALLRRTLERALRCVEEMHLAELLASEIELIELAVDLAGFEAPEVEAGEFRGSDPSDDERPGE